jgi:hypothetical protein
MHIKIRMYCIVYAVDRKKIRVEVMPEQPYSQLALDVYHFCSGIMQYLLNINLNKNNL